MDHPDQRDLPWTQQSLGCGKPGDFIYVPRSFISPIANKSLKLVGESLRNEWLKYRYGVFDAPLTNDVGDLDPTSRHFALCDGKSVKNVIEGHNDIKMTTLNPIKRRLPPITFRLGQARPVKYLIALEKTDAMNVNGNWDRISMAIRKFINVDLDDSAAVGLVLFSGVNAENIVSVNVGHQARVEISRELPNKNSLSPGAKACISCAESAIIDALSGTSSQQEVGAHAAVILITQGRGESQLSYPGLKALMEVSRKYRLQFFPMAVVAPQHDLDGSSITLEQLALETGGASFFVGKDDAAANTPLSTYVGLVDAFREIQARMSDDGPFLVSI